MQTIFVKDLADHEHELPATAGVPVMEIIRGSGLPMKAVCGGTSACGTCHVYVLDGWDRKLAPAGAEETGMLDFLPVAKPNSRLACQLHFNASLSGLRLQLAPE